MSPNALTIDLEDWYQGLTSTSQRLEEWHQYEDRVVENTERLLDIFDEGGIKATFFVLGYVANQFPELIQKVAEAGHEIGVHSYYHRKVSQITPDQFREDVIQAREAIEKITSTRVAGYRAPMFSLDKKSLWALEILNDLGFKYDSSIFPVRNLWYGLPDAPRFPYHPLEDHGFMEFPLSTVRVLGINWPIAGGFYLRLLPYWFLKWGITRIQKEGEAAIIYMHPWDLDVGQPVPNPTRRERFTHYYNLKSAEKKLRALIDDFQFAPLRDLIE